MTDSRSLDNVNKVVSNPSFAITTSLVWDPSKSAKSQAVPLRFHQARLLASAQKFNLTGLTTTLSGEAYLSHLTNHITSHAAHLPRTPHKITFSLAPDGTLTTTHSPAHPPLYPFHLPNNPPRPSSTLTATIYLALHSTPSSPFTTHKTNHRPHYTAARESCSLTPSTLPTSIEVLLYNDRDEITEASLSTVYFWRDGRWITPAAGCGGNLGVSRALALEEGWCVEGLVKRGEVRTGEVVGLSNGVRGFWFAVVRELEEGEAARS